MARGHIRKRGSRYSIVVELAPDPVTGKRRQKWLSARTKKEADQLLVKTLHEINQDDYIEPSTALVSDYLHSWLAKAEDLRPTTRNRYQQAIDGHLIPQLGMIPLAKLSPLHIQDAYAVLRSDGLSGSTLALDHGVLHHALDQAVKWRLLRYNPADAVDAPRPHHPEMQTWTAEQVRVFLVGTADDPHAAMWRLALSTGMRRGELLALRWGDVDLERGMLAVRRTLTRGTDGLTFGEPKTRAGQRAIALPVSCITALKEHRRRQVARRLELGSVWHDTDLVFERGDGQLLPPSSCGYTFQRAIARLGLPRIRFHDLRHTAATLMLANGEHPKIVQERLGHSDIAMTLNRYSHVSMDMQREAADRLEKVLSDG